MHRNKSSSTMKNHGSMVLQKLNNSFLETILEVTEYLGLTYRVLKKKRYQEETQKAIRKLRKAVQSNQA